MAPFPQVERKTRKNRGKMENIKKKTKSLGDEFTKTVAAVQRFQRKNSNVSTVI